MEIFFDICDVKTEMRRGHLFKVGQILIQRQKARALSWVSRPWLCWFGGFWLLERAVLEEAELHALVQTPGWAHLAGSGAHRGFLSRELI